MNILRFSVVQCANVLVAAMRACGDMLDDRIGDDVANIVKLLHAVERKIKNLEGS